jgi:hypothetical protein
MTTTRDLLEAVAGLITTAFPGAYSYTGDGLPDSSGATVPVVLIFEPADPDRIVTLHALPMSDDPSRPFGVALLQVKARSSRGNPLDSSTDLDQIFTALHARTGLEYGSWSIAQMLRQVRAPLGIDGLNRLTEADHYEVQIDYPATDHRPDGGAW